MIIRPGKREDAAVVGRLLEQLGHPLSESEVLDKIDLYTQTGHRLIVCEMDGRPTGFISIHWFDMFHAAGKTGRITALCVEESVREVGIGSALLSVAEALLREHGCKQIEVTSNMQRVRTPDFYRKHGYAERSRHFIKFVT